MGTNRSNSYDNAGIGQALGLSIVITLGGSCRHWMASHSPGLYKWYNGDFTTFNLKLESLDIKFSVIYIYILLASQFVTVKAFHLNHFSKIPETFKIPCSTPSTKCSL